ncbi:MAG: serine/threonine protein kinase [Deltaproteobacteria bacterium]|nr:serine/threonine protein kinase [Deltaproteobacteria bacterium]
MKLQPGQRFGNYRVDRLVGVGGQAAVYLAHDVLLKRRAALKMLRKGRDWMGSQVEEARVVATLDHPNIVRVYHVEVTTETCMMVMEYIDGGSLESRVKRLGPCDPKEALEFTMAALEALHHAHSRGVVHRDLKPRNLLITRDGTIKLADFGLASFGGPNDRDTKKIVGTPHYMPPEVWAGNGATIKSDIYSLGACLYFMLAAHPPFDGTTMGELKAAHTASALTPPPGAPSGLTSLLELAMAKGPDERPSAETLYDRAQEAYQDLTSNIRYPQRLDPVVAERLVEDETIAPMTRFLRKTSAAFDRATWLIESVAKSRQRLETALDLPLRLTLVGGDDRRFVARIVRGALSAKAKTTRLDARLDVRADDGTLLESMRSFAGASSLSHRPEGSDGSDRSAKYNGHDGYDAVLSTFARRLRRTSSSDDALVLLYFHRTTGPKDLGDLLEIAQRASEARLRLLVCCNVASLTEIMEGVEPTQLGAETRAIEVPRIADADLLRYIHSWTEVATSDRLRWTRDACLLALDGEAQDIGSLDRILQNSVMIALQNDLRLITTWCVLGAVAHTQTLHSHGEIEAAWQRPAPRWPTEDLMARLPHLRIRYQDALNNVELGASWLGTTIDPSESVE